MLVMLTSIRNVKVVFNMFITAVCVIFFGISLSKYGWIFELFDQLIFARTPAGQKYCRIMITHKLAFAWSLCVSSKACIIGKKKTNLKEVFDGWSMYFLQTWIRNNAASLLWLLLFDYVLERFWITLLIFDATADTS